ncbi:MAG: hypothetical protein HC886_14045 [Leptolyngbyaceae cyanobacterium SM1_1_3]|nr:hypothetical protein [Leptolyngbyaceae cyanobacterium SM1_1_3]NJN04486.1 hypothetical protein [Leptolyngbyaceae cyanobacterium RM1_1_2]NJO10671.1 hypothetical protein [Leptolyngbyaceae cyanobacterium SL_1_1]
MELTTPELKFLMRLLAHPDYRASLSRLSPNAKTSAAQRERLCRQLSQKGLVDYSQEISRFALSPAGRTFLGLDHHNLLVTPDELLTLKSAAKGSLTPEQIHSRVAIQTRQRLIGTLAERKLVKITKIQIQAAWLTTQGQTFLRHHYSPYGHAQALTLTMLGDYLKFIRQAATHSLNPS